MPSPLNATSPRAWRPSMGGDDKARERAEKKRQDYLDVPKKTNLGDSATIKRIMDDAVIQVSVARPNGGPRVMAAHTAVRNDRRWYSTRPTWASTIRRTPR